MQPPIRNPSPPHRNHLESLKPLLNDSTKQFLAQHRAGRTDFSDFESIFTRLLQDHPDPPLELLWFYSAVVFHSSKQDFGGDPVRLTRSLFQMLVPLSDSFSGAKRVATLSPLVYNLSRLVKSRRRREEALELLDGIVNFVSAYCGGGGEDGLLMVTGFSFADLSRVWVVDEEEAEESDCLEMFMPFVSERLRREVGSESCSVGCLAGIVASQLILLSLCLRFDSAELRKDLRESVLQMIYGFQHSCYFFVLRMQTRVIQMEDGKENGILVRSGKSKPFPAKLLLILGLFLAFALTVFVISVSTIKYTGLQSVVTTVTSGFVTCREEDEPSSLSKWIQPPSVLMHNMTDEELLWRASFSPRRKEYPFRRVPKIAFMFLTKGPLPLALLWERFLKGHRGLYSVYVHPHPSFTAKFPASSVFHRRQIPSQVAEWGRMTMCDAEKRLLANALLDISNEWFVLVSESCIPLYNFTTIYSYLSRSKHSFMGAFDDPGPFGRGRYNENMEPEVPITKWRKGSQWFEINRELAATIVKDTLYYPKFKEFCRPACYVDEHYFPTMLTIEKPMALANRSLTWVDWSRGGPHPATFGRSDITEKFFEKIFDGKNCAYNGRNTSMCYLFARKFAPSALEPLLHIAPKIMGF